MLLELKRVQVPPGQHIILRDITWQEFEQILTDLGEHRAARIAYKDQFLEIMTPLAEHEDNKEIVSDLIKVLLEELNIEFRCLGSTTFRKETSQGLEPDQCFYIKNEAKIRGKSRIDLSIDPPPDLALEIDITSRTYPDIYAALGVPELWRFERNTLQINVLIDGHYQSISDSQIFAGWNLIQVIPQFLADSKVEGRTTILRKFRRWVQQQRS
ncbi:MULTISPECIES: Uma2 family endonuclease [Cyanophyceae]|uniref:Uma2 family endonuclease n=1 Tax=Cyanophyceae TaxID=3028117 RepID=UPI0004A9EE68|nr:MULTISPECIES: Uma2 family endonuclease [Cyanophyceae]